MCHKPTCGKGLATRALRQCVVSPLCESGLAIRPYGKLYGYSLGEVCRKALQHKLDYSHTPRAWLIQQVTHVSTIHP